LNRILLFRFRLSLSSQPQDSEYGSNNPIPKDQQNSYQACQTGSDGHDLIGTGVKEGHCMQHECAPLKVDLPRGRRQAISPTLTFYDNTNKEASMGWELV